MLRGNLFIVRKPWNPQSLDEIPGGNSVRRSESLRSLWGEKTYKTCWRPLIEIKKRTKKKAVYHRKHAKDMGLGHCMENCMENCWMMMGNSRLGLKCYRFLNVSQHPRQRYAQFFRLPNIQQAAGLLGALAYGQWRGEPSPRFSETAWFLWAKRAVKRNSNNLGMDQYLLIPFLVGWTSIYQLFWCSPGVQGFDPLPLKCVVFFFMALWIVQMSNQPNHWNEQQLMPRTGESFASAKLGWWKCFKLFQL